MHKVTCAAYLLLVFFVGAVAGKFANSPSLKAFLRYMHQEGYVVMARPRAEITAESLALWDAFVEAEGIKKINWGVDE